MEKGRSDFAYLSGLGKINLRGLKRSWKRQFHASGNGGFALGETQNSPPASQGQAHSRMGEAVALLDASHVRLHVALMAKQMTKQELAEMVTISRQYLNRLMSGQQDLRNVRGHIVIELSRALERVKKA